MATKTAVKAPDIEDVKTGEILSTEDCVERLRQILTKKSEIRDQVTTVAKLKKAREMAEGAEDAARDALKGLRKELSDLEDGQRRLPFD